MIVFTNTSPLISLACIKRLDLLPQVFQTVHVTNSVLEECDAGGPIVVPDLRSFDWLVPTAGPAAEHSPRCLEDLDRGERDTLAAALAARADLVIIDERLGRQAAEHLGLRVVGTLGVLAKAKAEGLLASFRGAAEEMLRSGIRFHPTLVERLAERVGE